MRDVYFFSSIVVFFIVLLVLSIDIGIQFKYIFVIISWQYCPTVLTGTDIEGIFIILGEFFTLSQRCLSSKYLNKRVCNTAVRVHTCFPGALVLHWFEWVGIHFMLQRQVLRWQSLWQLFSFLFGKLLCKSFKVFVLTFKKEGCEQSQHDCVAQDEQA